MSGPRRRKHGAPAAAWVMLALALAVAPAPPALAATPDGVQELEWEDLIPKDWDPLSGFEALFDGGAENLSDDSPEAIAMFDAYLEAVRSAPVVGDLDGREIRLPGFVVPLDFDGAGTTSEFLLVPYFGACIHVPPPPPNQIVYVTTQPGYPLEDLFDAVWVTGVISTKAHLNEVGDAGYTMHATIVEPF